MGFAVTINLNDEPKDNIVHFTQCARQKPFCKFDPIVTSRFPVSMIRLKSKNIKCGDILVQVFTIWFFSGGCHDKRYAEGYSKRHQLH